MAPETSPPLDARPGMRSLLKAESLKLRRSCAASLPLLLVAVGGVVAAMLKDASASVAASRHADAAAEYVSLCQSAWATVFAPLFVVLRSAAVGQVEFANRGLKHLFVLPVARERIYLAKLLSTFAAAAGATLASLVVSIAVGMAIGAMTAGSLHGFWPQALRSELLMLAGVAALCSVQVAIAVNVASFAAVVSLGVGCTLAGLFGASILRELAVFFPWSMPAALMSAGSGDGPLVWIWIGVLLGLVSYVGARRFRTQRNI